MAPPDHHLMVDSGRATLWRGPKENRHRPAINALFRSAAVTYTTRVVGVILSGAMEDGAAGLWWIKRYGGISPSITWSACTVASPVVGMLGYSASRGF